MHNICFMVTLQFMGLKINSLCLYKVRLAGSGSADIYSNQTKQKTALVHNVEQKPGKLNGWTVKVGNSSGNSIARGIKPFPGGLTMRYMWSIEDIRTVFRSVYWQIYFNVLGQVFLWALRVSQWVSFHQFSMLIMHSSATDVVWYW
jgi:hypothetical protein